MTPGPEIVAVANPPARGSPDRLTATSASMKKTKPPEKQVSDSSLAYGGGVGGAVGAAVGICVGGGSGAAVGVGGGGAVVGVGGGGTAVGGSGGAVAIGPGVAVAPAPGWGGSTGCAVAAAGEAGTGKLVEVAGGAAVGAGGARGAGGAVCVGVAAAVETGGAFGAAAG